MCSFQPQLTWHCTHPHFNLRHHTLLESYSILFYSLLLSGCTVSDSSIALTLICIFFGTNAAAGSQTVISRWELRAEGANSYANLCYTRNHEMLIRNNKLSLRQRLSLFIVSLQNWDFLYFLHHSAQMCSNFENIFKKFPSKLESRWFDCNRRKHFWQKRLRLVHEGDSLQGVGVITPLLTLEDQVEAYMWLLLFAWSPLLRCVSPCSITSQHPHYCRICKERKYFVSVEKLLLCHIVSGPAEHKHSSHSLHNPGSSVDH